MNYLQIEFETLENGQAEILIASLADAGFESFEEKENSLLAYIKEDGFEEDDLEPILQIVPVNYAITVVPQQNWNAEWESSFQPIVVNNFVAIRADFHQPVKGVEHDIIITPKMSFGTGHHATTYMMVEQMQQLDFKNKTVVDYGCGTGVLAILAQKMGAIDIDAIDYDLLCIDNSIENVEANNCTDINVIKAETISTGKVYDIVLANINLNVLVQNMPAIQAACKKGSYILLSGFMVTDEQAMKQTLLINNIQPLKILENSGWLSILAQMG